MMKRKNITKTQEFVEEASRSTTIVDELAKRLNIENLHNTCSKPVIVNQCRINKNNMNNNTKLSTRQNTQQPQQPTKKKEKEEEEKGVVMEDPTKNEVVGNFVQNMDTQRMLELLLTQTMMLTKKIKHMHIKMDALTDMVQEL
eukprot:CAMPEP_0117426102 /NCGR_PEP_ID=MMETSP0758-20121206/6268_1 /TAXON_ID=63605 /ORGANISM="Percolomonas cosmopolitus, Strain AE-1 (ATCC 50343)" /LENGTH=142 /DNA_ID=CAMNT_0005211039 /DNA_START=167 /DNA_END=591 /DNA_ORIENTATION=+